MSTAADNRGSTPVGLRRIYAPIQNDLDEVEAFLRRELSSRFSFVDELVKHGFRLGGKRMRPALVLLSGRASGRCGPDHLLLAAVVEMIHTATLIHDDVLDEAALRRHLATVNARWDNEASVLLGDYLFTLAVSLASQLDDPYACREIGESSRTMCEGELRQMERRGHYDLDEAEYLEIIAEKTAALCACCCSVGAHYGGADRETKKALIAYGADLGVAFQIADDLLDLLGSEDKTGKSLGTDLDKQKPTLPLIRLLGQAGAEDRREVLSLLSRSGNHRREALRSWFTRYDAVSYARQKAEWFIERAKSRLAVLAPSEFRDSLELLATFVVERQH